MPYKKTSNAIHVVKLFLKEEVRLHGFLKTIVTHKDTKFTSYFWKTPLKKKNIELMFTSRCHPQINGQTKIVNRSLASSLRFLVANKPTN